MSQLFLGQDTIGALLNSDLSDLSDLSDNTTSKNVWYLAENS